MMNQRHTSDHQFLSVVAICLGCVDLIRGLLHTVRVEHAAGNIAGLDLSTKQAHDLMLLMSAFGISNLLTGSMLILIAIKARALIYPILAIIPAAYLLGTVSLHNAVKAYPPSEAVYPGKRMMAIYLTVSLGSFLMASWKLWFQKKRSTNKSSGTDHASKPTRYASE